MSRPMTAAEKTRFRGYFPSLDVDRAVVTGEQSSVYNCISWTVGVTDRWLWPGASLANFDTLYRSFGFVRAGDGPIAAWGASTTSMTHGSISGPGHGPRWESKCGPDLRIQHGLNELAGSTYGHVIAFYRRNSSLSMPAEAPAEGHVKGKAAKSYLTKQQKLALSAERDSLSAARREAFEKAFQAWKASWFEGGLAINSDPHSRAVGQHFDTLVGMGSSVLPLLIEKLAVPENFFALQLYDVMQPNPTLLVQFEPDDDRIVEGEQGRAQRVVQKWFTNR